MPSLRTFARKDIEVRTFEKEGVLLVRRREVTDQTFCLFNVRQQQANITVLFPEGEWQCVLDSNSPRWGGSGPRVPGVIASSGQETALLLPEYTVALYRLQNTPGLQEDE